MSRLTAEHAGTVVKTIGDEIMARFDSAGDACRAAMAIQQYCSMASGDEALAVRIGIAYGPTLLDQDDTFGDTVNDAVLVKQGRAIRKDRKSTRLNSSHVAISYAVFCLKKKITKTQLIHRARA